MTADKQPREPRDIREDHLAEQPIDAFDERALRAVATLYAEADPLPDGILDRIAFGITLDALEADIAQLQRLELTGARSDNASGEIEVKTVTFSADSMELMVTVTPDGLDTVRIDGWLAPGAGAEVEVRLSSGRRTTLADEDGRFVVEDVPRGLAKFVIHPAGAEADATVITPSMEV